MSLGEVPRSDTVTGIPVNAVDADIRGIFQAERRQAIEPAAAIVAMRRDSGNCGLYESFEAILSAKNIGMGVRHRVSPQTARERIAEIHFPVCTHPESHPSSSQQI